MALPPPAAGAGTEMRPSFKRARPAKAPTSRHTLLNYYICTLTGCNWRGVMPKNHKASRPTCPSYPCVMLYAKGTKAGDAADAFLKRCTPRQRELGLAPDGSKPVPQTGPNGRVDPDILYLTVPIGLTGGDTFTVPTGRGARAMVTVPDGKMEGDVLSIYANTNRAGVGERAPTDPVAGPESAESSSGGQGGPQALESPAAAIAASAVATVCEARGGSDLEAIDDT